MLIPHNIDAERAVIGSILLDNESLYDIIDLLDFQDFYIPDHQEVYKFMVENPDKIDIVSINEKIKKPDLLANIVQNTISAGDISNHAKIVKDKSIRRQLLQASEKTKEIITDNDKDTTSVLSDVQNSFLEIGLYKESDDSVESVFHEVDLLQKTYQENLEKGKDLLGYSCGFKKIDEAIDGIRPHHVWVVGAWSSTGKTQFALNILNSVLMQKIPSAIISLEMSKVDMIARLLGIKTKTDSRKLIKGLLPSEKFQEVQSAQEFLKNSPLLLHTDYFELSKIKHIIRKDSIVNKTKFFIIDYLQNIRGDGREYDTITKAATELQALARELEITILLVSQISNEAQKGQSAGAGFKGSGAIEAIADIAIRLKRDKEKESIVDGKVVSPVCVDVLLAKNRHGVTGATQYGLYLESGVFVENYKIADDDYVLDI